MQKKKLGNLTYKLIKEYGPDHDKEFQIAVCINDIEYGIGFGKNKKTSEQKAAVTALNKLKKEHGN